MNEWKVIDTGIGSAQQNMDIDKRLLNKINESREPILHLYEWDGLCATYGYFTTPSDLLNMDGVDKFQLQLGKRPTGGGVIFHVCDLAFSVLIPSSHPKFSLNTLENYALVNEAVIDAIMCFTGDKLSPTLYHNESMGGRQVGEHFCMAKPTQYDVMIDGYKVGGAAQRRTKEGLLHQGSISLAMPPMDLLKGVLRSDSNIFSAMQDVSFTLLEGDVSSQELNGARQKMRQNLSQSLQKLI